MSNNDVVELNHAGILETVKKLLGLTKEYTAFDMDIVVHINSVFSTLTQMGVGPEEGFIINGYGETWDDYIQNDNPAKIQQIKTYIYQKVRTYFDPPANSNLLEALNRSIAELEYRLYTEKGGY